MLDIKFIKQNPGKVKDNIKKRGFDPKLADVDRLLGIDEKRVDIRQKVEDTNRHKNELAKKFQGADDKNGLRKEGEQLKKEGQKAEAELKKLDTEAAGILAWIPNMLTEDTPDGKTEDDNVELKVWCPEKGYMPEKDLGKADNKKTPKFMPKHDFNAKDHVEIGKDLDIIDIEQAARVSGSRFYYLKNEATLLEFALMQLLLEKLLKDDFVPLTPPLLVRERALFGTSHIPEGADQIYKIEKKHVENKNQLHLIGSAEPANFAYFMDKTLDEKDLPKKVCAYTPCFRTEVGSWGKDVRGIKRVHQFNKLEMNVVCTPDQSKKIFEELLGLNEWLLQELKLPYRIVHKCAGDSGYAASHKQYDVEVWAPVDAVFMEFGTCTNAADYQARRLNIKYTTKAGKREYCHTVNNTGVAMPRTIIAILENYQREDGSVEIPEALQRFLGKDVITPK